MLPRLFSILQTGQGSPADIGEEYLAKMRLRVPQVCHMIASGMQLEPVLEMHELYCASHRGSKVRDVAAVRAARLHISMHLAHQDALQVVLGEYV